MSAKKSKPSKAGSLPRPAPVPAVSHEPPRPLWTTWGLWAGLVVVTLIAYYPAWHGAPLWDDDAHLTRVDLRSLTGLWRIWFDVGATQQYYPVAHSAFWLFHVLWGDDTLGYHLVNIALHATSAYLVAVILRRLAIPGAALAALIFALHPVHVESVAWITELKNTLSGVCYLGAVLTYLRFDATRERRWYAVTLALFVLALLSKSVTASLPAALLVVFWLQRGRVRWQEDARPLLPLFGLGLASGLFTAWVERSQIGADGPQFQFSLIERCLIAGRAVWFYLGKLVWPDPLIFSYPRWHVSQAVWWQYLFPVALAALFAGLWLIRHRTRAPLAAMLFFTGTLFPALGFVNVYPFIYSFVADHFQYLASLGVITLFAAGVATVIARRVARPDAALAAIALIVGLPAGALTWHQSGQYRDAETLYRTTLSLNPDSWMAHINLGKIQQQAAHAHGDDPALLTEAMQEFREAIRIEPGVSQAHNNLGTVLLGLGQNDAAADEYREALRLRPGDAQVQYNLGLVLQRQGRPDDAIATIQSSLATRPNDPSAHLALGDALQSAGRFDEAIAAYTAALRLDPNDAEVHNNLGSALGHLGRLDEAIAQYQAALAINPRSARAGSNLGLALLRRGRTDEAIAALRQAVAAEPGFVGAHRGLGQALEQADKHGEAAVEFAEAARLQPDAADIRNDLGIALAESGRYQDAVVAFREALRLKPDFEEARDNLQRALAMIKSGGSPSRE